MWNGNNWVRFLSIHYSIFRGHNSVQATRINKKFIICFNRSSIFQRWREKEKRVNGNHDVFIMHLVIPFSFFFQVLIESSLCIFSSLCMWLLSITTIRCPVVRLSTVETISRSFQGFFTSTYVSKFLVLVSSWSSVLVLVLTLLLLLLSSILVLILLLLLVCCVCSLYLCILVSNCILILKVVLCHFVFCYYIFIDFFLLISFFNVKCHLVPFLQYKCF